MTVCLDTSAYSFLRRGHPEIIEIVQTAPRLALSTIVLGELLAGFRLGGRFKQNKLDLDRFLASPRVRLMAADATTASRYGEIAAYLRRQGTPLPGNDIWIAATAMQHGLEVVTFDKDFTRMPQISTIVLSP